MKLAYNVSLLRDCHYGWFLILLLQFQCHACVYTHDSIHRWHHTSKTTSCHLRPSKIDEQGSFTGYSILIMPEGYKKWDLSDWYVYFRISTLYYELLAWLLFGCYSM